MPTYRLVVEYDGSRFHGFQPQREHRTVGGELERALARVFDEPLAVTAAGRTDAGVHATSQVVSFRAARTFPVERLPIALDANTPEDLAVREAAIVDAGFSARFDARERRYEYVLLERAVSDPLTRLRAFRVWRPIDDERFRAAAAPLVGEHDFVAFCGELPERGGTVREVRRIALERRGERLRVTVVGNAFLHRMVRVLVGTLVECATGYRDVEHAARALASRDRRAAGLTAPPHGLYFAGVTYDDGLVYRPAPGWERD